MPKWKLNGWRRREGGQLKPIKNEDLWRQLDELLAKHQVRFTHVRGHQGHPENERCDTAGPWPPIRSIAEAIRGCRGDRVLKSFKIRRRTSASPRVPAESGC